MKKLLSVVMLLSVSALNSMSNATTMNVANQTRKPIISGVPTPANLPQPNEPIQTHLAPSAVAPHHVLGPLIRGLVNASYEFVRTNGSQSATEALHHAAMSYVAHHKHIMGSPVIMPGPVMPAAPTTPTR